MYNTAGVVHKSLEIYGSQRVLVRGMRIESEQDAVDFELRWIES